jgi:hypothetical protein
MTKKSRMLFVVLAYMALGVTAGFANKHHHHVKDGGQKTDGARNTSNKRSKHLFQGM